MKIAQAPAIWCAISLRAPALAGYEPCLFFYRLNPMRLSQGEKAVSGRMETAFSGPWEDPRPRRRGGTPKPVAGRTLPASSRGWGDGWKVAPSGRPR